jgi:hypothetical protein
MPFAGLRRPLVHRGLNLATTVHPPPVTRVPYLMVGLINGPTQLRNAETRIKVPQGWWEKDLSLMPGVAGPGHATPTNTARRAQGVHTKRSRGAVGRRTVLEVGTGIGYGAISGRFREVAALEWGWRWIQHLRKGKGSGSAAIPRLASLRPGDEHAMPSIHLKEGRAVSSVVRALAHPSARSGHARPGPAPSRTARRLLARA